MVILGPASTLTFRCPRGQTEPYCTPSGNHTTKSILQSALRLLGGPGDHIWVHTVGEATQLPRFPPLSASWAPIREVSLFPVTKQGEAGQSSTSNPCCWGLGGIHQPLWSPTGNYRPRGKGPLKLTDNVKTNISVKLSLGRME